MQPAAVVIIAWLVGFAFGWYACRFTLRSVIFGLNLRIGQMHNRLRQLQARRDDVFANEPWWDPADNPY